MTCTCGNVRWRHCVMHTKCKKRWCLGSVVEWLLWGEKKEGKKELEVRGFDPRASPMRTVRSTNWAKPPFHFFEIFSVASGNNYATKTQVVLQWRVDGCVLTHEWNQWFELWFHISWHSIHTLSNPWKLFIMPDKPIPSDSFFIKQLLKIAHSSRNGTVSRWWKGFILDNIKTWRWFKEKKKCTKRL